ncbi:MAG: PhzF family phenazine biosynthesis protein [Pseudomonadota bacterium]
MTAYAVDWVDAFSAHPFGGNGCAVVHGGAILDDATCINFVRETSLVECTFTGPSEVADFRVRYFVASGEIPFAGHPTIATVAALRSRDLVPGDALTLETHAGVIPIRLDGARIEMTQVAPVFGPVVPRDVVAKAVGLSAKDIIADPQVVSTGLPFTITLLRSKDALRRARLNLEALRVMSEFTGASSLNIKEPFLVTLGGETPAGDTFARLLLAPPSPAEDPFTGSATGAMASYLWHHGLLGQDSFVAEQGHWVGRPGQAYVTRVGSATQIEGVRVAGDGYVLMRGDLLL